MKFKKKIDVLLFIEHIDRELELAEEIKSALNDHGFSCKILSSIYHNLLALLNYDAKIIVTPSTSFGKGSISWCYENSTLKPPKYINLNYEQFISSWKGKYKSPKHEVSKNKQIHYCWGESFKQILTSSGIPEANIRITGRPYFQLLSEKYKAKSFRTDIASKVKIDPMKKWFFIGLTDGLAFVNEQKIKYIIEQGGDEVGLRTHIENVKKTIRQTLLWISNHENNDDYIFILRPHPSISQNQYQKLIVAYLGYVPKNIIISKFLTAQKWMVSSDKFLTNYSTLALDASALEIPFNILNPLNSDLSEYWWLKGGVEINSKERFDELIYGNFSNDWLLLMDYSSNLEENIDMSKKGKTETINNIITYLKNATYSSSSIFLIFITIIKAPRRILGGYLRYVLSKSKILKKYVKTGLQMDFFTFN